ncbi:MAG TPA: alpha/beta fold hydrolase [Thermoanaerobaculia bacterium]
MRLLAIAVLASVVPLGLATAPAEPTAPEPRRPALQLSTCSLPDVPFPARCGRLEVFEDRARATGRRLSLTVAILAARSPHPRPDPIVYLAGGPGVAATGEAGFVASTFAPLLAERDVILVDLRGTGGSNPLDCELGLGLLTREATAAELATCREHLAGRADLRFYTTALAMDDLDDVRAALGVPVVNLLAHSYGTLAAQVYVARHGEHVRAAVLESVLPPGPEPYLADGEDAERALGEMLAACAREPACHAAYPHPRDELNATLARLAAKPVEVLSEKILLTRDVFAATVRARMYSAKAAARLPRALHEAYAGDYRDMAHAAATIAAASANGQSQALHLSVVCTGAIGALTREQIEARNKNTFLGAAPLLARHADCAAWPRGEAPADLARPLASEVPALVLSGAWDPVTPPRNAERVQRGFPRSLALTVPEAGHAFDDACTVGIVRAFLDAGSANGLDSGCLARKPRVVFEVGRPPA